MLKPKKRINENAVKKDFFAKKKIKNINHVNILSEINNLTLLEVIELKDVDLPKKGETSFVRSIRSRPITDFIKNKEVTDIYVLCSRIKEKFVKEFKSKINGILVQDKIFEIEKDWLVNYRNVKKNNNHSKIIIFKSNGDCYVVYGSGNPSVNARNEIYVLENSNNKYHKIKEFFDNV